MSTQSGMDVKEPLDPQLTRFWHETRLRATPGPPPEILESAQPAVGESWLAISEVLALGYGERSGAVITKGKTLMRARTTPSAGALYPFELLVAFRGETQYELYEYDVVGCCLRHAGPVDAAETAALLAGPDAGADEAPPPEAVVAIVGRPWASMRKYGRRGYLYTHLDGAHAATNITLAAQEAGFRPVTHLRFDRRQAADVLGIADRCREPQTLITLTAPGAPAAAWDGKAANPFAVPIWRHGDGVRPEEPGDEERAAWRSIQSISAFHHRGDTPRRYGSARSVVARAARTAAAEPADARPAVRLHSGNGRNATPRPFADTVLERRSAKGFLPVPVDNAPFGRMLAGLRQGAALDSADGPLAQLRLLVRNVDGIEAGAYDYDAEGHALRPVGGDGRTDDAVVAACMSQAVVRSAAALFVLHSPVGPLLGARGPQGLAELHYHAAGAAQRLCVAAAKSAVGITCLGGFDEGRVAELVCLPDSEEVIYVLACGVPDETAVKWDRAPIAYSHGRGPARQS
ncbi:nitroreductase family protein [Streptomyces sp. NPDC057271]|uniref:nitroreductase family protein n=1 Tax=unclassified Streptomyces TaxID=2593676 RepID=UPI0036290232